MVRGADWDPRLDDPEIQEYLREAAGDEGIALFRFILEREPITGMEILEAYADEKPSDVRKLLYRLMMAHALEYHKDTDTTGWETFHWRTDLPEIKLIHLRQWRQELEDLRKRLRFEESHQFYACPQGHERVLFEDAFGSQFHCPDCGEPMAPADGEAVMGGIRERIHELESALEE